MFEKASLLEKDGGRREQVISRLTGSKSDRSHVKYTHADWRSVWTDNTTGTHLRPHPLGSASDAAGLLRLHRLPLGQVVGGVLLVLCVVGQGGFLHTAAGESKSIGRHVNTCTDIHTRQRMQNMLFILTLTINIWRLESILSCGTYE